MQQPRHGYDPAAQQVCYAGGSGKMLELQLVDRRGQHISHDQQVVQVVAAQTGSNEGDEDQKDDSDSQDDHLQLPPNNQVQQLVPAVSPEELAEITAKVRHNEKGEPTSVGSAGHEDNCRACLFVFTAAGCQNGVLCGFCHFKHKRANRPRPCKGKRNRFRKLAARVEQLQGPALPDSAPLPQKFAL